MEAVGHRVEVHMKKLELKLKQNCSGNMCPMPLNIVVHTIKGLELLHYDEKTLVAELSFDETIVSEEDIVKKLEERKYPMVK